jgi:hypothetical protein
LNISEDASEEDIRKAYRKLAKLHHPDVNKSPDAAAKFMLINTAYEVLIDRKKRIEYDQKIQVTKNPFYTYTHWVNEQKLRQEAEVQRKYKEFLEKKERIRQSKMYYPYMILLYVCTISLVGLSLLVLIVCAFVIFRYHLLMFFFLLPFICVAAYVLKVTLDEYKKYKALFN